MNNETIQDQLLHVHIEPPTRQLKLFTAGSFLCGIFENEIATVSTWREPAPLPHAPHSVLGVVSIQGRMLTVLNLATLLDVSAASRDWVHQHIIALRGDEQLALAVDAVTETLEIADGVLDGMKDVGLIRGVINHKGAEITILNVKEVFPSAIQGRERRRRRF